MSEQQKIVLTGGTGTLGSELLKDLVNSGYHCIVFTRSPEKHNNSDNIQYIRWIPDSDYLMQYINASFAVINLAGSSIAGKRWTEKYKQELIDSRIEATTVLVEAINKSTSKPKKFLSSSASGYYGNRGDEILTEESGCGNSFLSNLCKQWETAAMGVDESVQLVITRTGVVLTPSGGAFEKILLPFKLFIGGKIGNGEQYFPWISVVDWKSFLIFALQNEVESKIYNLVSPNAVTNSVLTKAIGKIYNKPTVFRVPKFVLKLALGELSSLIIDSQRIKAKNIENTNFIYKYGLLEKAINNLKNIEK